MDTRPALAVVSGDPFVRFAAALALAGEFAQVSAYAGLASFAAALAEGASPGLVVSDLHGAARAELIEILAGLAPAPSLLLLRA